MKSSLSKKVYIIPVLVLFFSQFMWSCWSYPDLAFAPKITFDRVEFVEAGFLDSLLVFINFEDGDGDLGLRGDETNPPYHPYDFIRDSNGQLITFGSRPGLPGYNPLDWVINPEINGVVFEDTFLIRINENHYNYFIEFMIKQPNGNFVIWDPKQPPFYQTFNGRFPMLNRSGMDRPLAGNLRYGMVSSQFRTIFGNNPIKLRIQIQDRSLNRSNTVESEEFTLESVSR
jgi:hypothetical protein